MLGVLLWGIGAVMALTEENEKVKTKNTEEQLERAKTIIKDLLPCCRNYPQENAEKIEQAEQFLKEIEK